MEFACKLVMVMEGATERMKKDRKRRKERDRSKREESKEKEKGFKEG